MFVDPYAAGRASESEQLQSMVLCLRAWEARTKIAEKSFARQSWFPGARAPAIAFRPGEPRTKIAEKSLGGSSWFPRAPNTRKFYL